MPPFTQLNKACDCEPARRGMSRDVSENHSYSVWRLFLTVAPCYCTYEVCCYCNLVASFLGLDVSHLKIKILLHGRSETRPNFSFLFITDRQISHSLPFLLARMPFVLFMEEGRRSPLRSRQDYFSSILGALNWP
jgi:hypothetical protein